MSPFEILGLGTALPEHSIVQSEAATFANACLAGEAESDRASTLVEALYRRSGVRSRHSVVLETSTSVIPASQTFYGESDSPDDRGPSTQDRMELYEATAPLLAVRASRKALEAAQLDPHQVTHLITVSCSGFSAPGFDLALINELRLSAGVSRTHVGFMGCHGALNALRVARAFAAADPEAVVLICALELCTLHHQYGWDPQRIVANSLFADGCAAIVGRALSANRQADRPQIRLIDNGSRVLPETNHMMTWKIGNHGFEMTLSPEVPDVITRMLPQALSDFLRPHGLRIDEIPSWAIHPGGPRILKACADVAKLSPQQLAPSEDVLSRCGNMSSPTVLFILEDLIAQQTAWPCVMLGFGPGLNVEMALLTGEAA
jgi:predicted naringenin-chalcone synthase